MKQPFALLLCLLFLLGCGQEGSSAVNATPSSAQEESSSLAVEAVADETENRPQTVSPTLAQCGLPPIKTLEVYRFWGDGKIYTREQVEISDEEQTLLSIVNRAASVLSCVMGPLPIEGISREKAFVVVDFEPLFLDSYAKAEVYEILTTVSMTLLQNGVADSVQFQRGGEVGIFGELYQPDALAFAPVATGDSAAIRKAIPYPGLSEQYFPPAEELASRFGVEVDATSYEIMSLLAQVGKMEHAAASPMQLDPARLGYHCILNTLYLSTEPGDGRYEPSLQPLADSVSAKLGMVETMFWLEEHLQQTAKVLCGNEVTLDLETFAQQFGYSYFPEEGIVTPPHSGGGYSTLPLVLSYEATPEGYRAEVVYLFDGMGGIGPWGMEPALTEQELPGYVANEAERAEVVVRRADDGGLRFVSYGVKSKESATTNA